MIPQTAAPLSSQQRWRSQQIDRQVINPPQTYIARAPVPLKWYDPATAQELDIGTLIGEFPVQAKFTLRNGNQPALEVPYAINRDFGLTAISDSLTERMRAAGYSESVEAYVIQSDAIAPK